MAARCAVVATLLVVASALASCSSASSGPYSASKILQFDRSTETVHLDLVAAATDSYDGFNFDGYGGGEMLVRVPVGWAVDVTCTNASTALTHSCAIVEGGAGSALSPEGGTIAFPGATIANAVNGLAYNTSASFRFVASRVGIFRIDCLVVGHEADGMWDWLVVAPSGTPSVTTNAHPLTPTS